MLGANSCSVLPDLTNQFVLLYASEECSVEAQAINAQNANAAGVIIAALPNQPLYVVCVITIFSPTHRHTYTDTQTRTDTRTHALT